MTRRIAQLASMLAALSCWSAYAALNVTLTLIPSSGAVQGVAGQTVGWGFTINNNTPYYLIFNNSYFCQPGQDPHFTTCTTALGGPNQYQDYIANNLTIIPPSTTLTVPFNLGTQTGFGAYAIPSNVPLHASDSGSALGTYDVYDGDPLMGGTEVFADQEISAPASVVVIPADAYQIGYAANIKADGSFVNLTNAGSAGGTDLAGDICANVYVFDPAQELVACCACLLTPNHLQALSVHDDLTSNLLTLGMPTSVTFGLVTSAPVSGACDPASPTARTLERGLRGWATTAHALPAAGYALTEYELSIAPLSDSELTKLTTTCAFIEDNGSGNGICNPCRTGALGAAHK